MSANPSRPQPAGHLSALDLDAIEARAAAATEGPWGVQQLLPEHREFEHEAQVMHDVGGPSYGFVASKVFITDAEFIAHARTDVDYLAAAVRRVLELHQPDATPEELYDGCNDGDCPGHEVICCAHCVGYHPEDSMLAIPVPWPCATVLALGIGS